MNTKRALLLVLCTLFTGIFSIYHHEKAHASTDPTENQYQISIGPVTGSTTASYVYASFFNPSASGKTMVVKRVRVNSDAISTATFQDLDVYRTSAASGGTQIATASIPKKNSLSANSVADIRYAGVATTLAGTSDSRLLAVAAAGAAGNTAGGRDYTFSNQQLVLQPGEGIELAQTAAGSANQRMRMAVEWEEVTSTPAATGDYMLSFPAVSNAAGTNYFYQTLFNPSGSGKTAVIARLNIDMDCSTTAVYTNTLSIKRISAASAGTQIAAANIPKKHTGSAASIIQARYGGGTSITATVDATMTGAMDQVTPCGAANQPQAHSENTYDDGVIEGIILQPGQGIALQASGTGSTAQLVRLSAVWGEQAAAPATMGQYTYSAGPVAASTTVATYAYAAFMNPSASGKTAVINRINVLADATTTSTATNLSLERITAASSGTAVTASTIPKNNTGSGTSAMTLFTANPTVTKVGTSAARLLTVDSPNAVGQLNGHMLRTFGTDEPLILQPGQGVVLYQEAAPTSGGFNVKVTFEWGEQASAPAATGEYMLTAGPVTGSATSGAIYSVFMNPTGSGKTVVFHRLYINEDATTSAAYVPMTIRRVTAVTGGTAIASTDKPVKHTGTGTSITSIVTSPTSVTAAGGTNARMYSVTSPGAAAAATTPQTTGSDDYDFSNNEPLVLQPGEGIEIYQEAAGSTGFKVRMGMEWAEQASAPASQNEYSIAIGQAAGTATAGYVYAALFNPSTTNKSYVVNRIQIEAVRTGTATTSYQPVTVRRITAASGGTTVTTTDIPKKNSSTPTSTADVRYSGVTTTPSAVDNARIMGISAPGAAGQDIGINSASIIYGDEIVLAPGEGIAMYQESAGDTTSKYTMRAAWQEVTGSYGQNSYRFYGNKDSAAPIDVGRPLAAQDTAATSLGNGQPFRMRTDVSLSIANAAAAGSSFKLQFAPMSTSCDTAFANTSNAAYSDVTDTTTVRYYGNAAAGNGISLASNANDPADGTYTIVRQTYQEATTATFSNASAMTVGQDGMWDFALTTNAATVGQHYCLRLVSGAGTPLAYYSVIPEFIVGPTAVAPDDPTTLSQTKTTSTVLNTGDWTNESSVVFTAQASTVLSTDTLQLCVEKDNLATTFSDTEDSCGTGAAYAGTPVNISVTLSGLPDGTQYHWQARVKSATGGYSNWVSYDTNAETAADFGVDTSPPSGGTVYDGTSAGTDGSFNDGSLNSLSANWSGINSGASGLAGYEYSVGTSPGLQDVKNWTSTGTTASVTVSGLNLHTSSKYFFNVRTTDAVGNVSTPISSDGQFVAPTLSFSVSPSVVTFANLNAANSYTDSKMTTLTTSTNAYGGYIIRSLTTDFFRSAGSKTITDFTGGSYASPDSWQAGDIGLGYTSSDTLVQGVNKFQAATCPGGSVLSAPGCFAPFTHAAPGNIVADNTSSVSGTPISNESFTITYRVTTLNTQVAAKYSASAIYSVTPVY